MVLCFPSLRSGEQLQFRLFVTVVTIHSKHFGCHFVISLFAVPNDAGQSVCWLRFASHWNYNYRNWKKCMQKAVWALHSEDLLRSFWVWYSINLRFLCLEIIFFKKNLKGLLNYRILNRKITWMIFAAHCSSKWTANQRKSLKTEGELSFICDFFLSFVLHLRTANRKALTFFVSIFFLSFHCWFAQLYFIHIFRSSMQNFFSRFGVNSDQRTRKKNRKFSFCYFVRYVFWHWQNATHTTTKR